MEKTLKEQPHSLNAVLFRARKANMAVPSLLRGASSHQQNPFFILCHPETGEDTGDSYGFMLMYSGNHKSEIEKDQAGSVRAVMGINDEGFSWKLESGDCYVHCL